MTTTVTQNADPLKVDVEEDITEGGVNNVRTYTKTKIEYIAQLNTEKDWVTASVTKMTADISTCNARSTEIDDIITAVNAL